MAKNKNIERLRADDGGAEGQEQRPDAIPSGEMQEAEMINEINRQVNKEGGILRNLSEKAKGKFQPLLLSCGFITWLGGATAMFTKNVEAGDIDWGFEGRAAVSEVRRTAISEIEEWLRELRRKREREAEWKQREIERRGELRWEERREDRRWGRRQQESAQRRRDEYIRRLEEIRMRALEKIATARTPEERRIAEENYNSVDKKIKELKFGQGGQEKPRYQRSSPWSRGSQRVR